MSGNYVFTGYDRFAKDVQTMTGNYPFVYWKYTWKFAAPVGTMAIVVFSWADFNLARYDDYTFPVWANAIGFLICLSSTSSIFIYGAYVIAYEPGTLMEVR